MSRSLLLADGSVTIQRVMELTFAHEDIRVIAVSDGRKAIQHLDTEQPDVVLVDVDSPEVDGYAVAAHIRRVPRLKGVPVLLLAGAFEPVDQERAREVGSDGVITKPFEPQVVVTRVKELIDQRDRQGAAAAQKAQNSQSQQSHVEEAPAPPRAAPPPQAPAPPPAAAAKPARSETSFPRAAELPTPPPLPEMPVVPEPLELPSKPIWDVRGSVATGEAPAEVLPLPAMTPSAAPTPPPAAAQAPPKVTLANAFTALLAAEQSVSPTPSITPSLNEASIEDAVRRVLVRMTDDLVRRIVVDTAERLIREEIERIKANPE